MARRLTFDLKVPFKPHGFRGDDILLEATPTGRALWKNRANVPVPTHVEVTIPAADATIVYVPVAKLHVGGYSDRVNTTEYSRHSELGRIAAFCFERSWQMGSVDEVEDGNDLEDWAD